MTLYKRQLALVSIVVVTWRECRLNVKNMFDVQALRILLRLSSKFLGNRSKALQPQDSYYIGNQRVGKAVSSSASRQSFALMSDNRPEAAAASIMARNSRSIELLESGEHLHST